MRKILCFSLCLPFLFCLTACRGDRETGKNSLQDNGSYISSDSTKHDTNISMTLSSGVIVDADIILSDLVDLNALSVCNARLVTQNFEKAKEVFLGNQEIVEEKTAETKESLTGSPFQYCRTSDGFSLVSSGQDLYFSGPLYDKVGSIFNRSESGNSELFLTGQDLAFASIEQAQKDIANILQQLSISVASDPLCYTLDYNTLVLECETYNKTVEGAFPGLLEPTSIEKSDECYLFLYQITSLDRPISMHMNGVFGDGSWTSGTSVLCAYSADGLVALQIQYLFEDMSQSSQTAKGMDIKQALERLDQKYNSLILEGEYLVDQIEFEYVPMRNQGKSNSYILVPAWRFSLLHNFEESQKENINNLVLAKQRTTSVFHAITGTELLIDTGNA